MAADGPEIGKAYVRIRPKADGFEGDAQKQIGDPLARVAKGAAAAFAAVAVGSFLKGGIDELGSAEKAAAQTEAAIRSTGGAANVTHEQIDDLTTSLANLSGADKEAVQGGANLLLTFRNVRNEVGTGNDIYDQALTLAQDLSVAYGQDLSSSAVLVGKALDNPIQGMTALQRVGVTLSAQQKEQVKDFVAAGDSMSAQKVILEELTKQVGGSAEAYGETLPGKLDRARNAFDDLKGEIVGGAAPALETIVDVVRPAVDAFSELPTGVQSGVLALGALALAAPKVSAAVGGIVSVAKAIPDAIGKASDAVAGMNAQAVGSNLAVGALAASVVALAVASQKAQATAAEGAKGAQESIVAAGKSDNFEELIDRIDRTKAAYSDLYGDANPLVRKNADEVGNAADALIDYANVAASFASQAGITNDQALTFLHTQEAAGFTYTDASSALAAYTGNVDTNAGSTEEATAATDGYAQSIRDATKATQESLDPFFAAAGASDRLAEAQGAAYRAAVQYGENSPEALAANEDLAQAALDQEAALSALAAQMADNQATTDEFDSALRRWVESGAITQGQADTVRAKFVELGIEADNVGAKNVEPKVSDASIRAAIALMTVLRGQFDRLGNDSAGGGFAIHGDNAGQDPVAAYLRSLNRKAAGGRVTKGQPYVVDEYGSEALDIGGQQVLIPGQDGTVIPSGQIGSNGGRQVHQTINFYGTGPLSTQEVVRVTRRAGLEALST